MDNKTIDVISRVTLHLKRTMSVRLKKTKTKTNLYLINIVENIVVLSWQALFFLVFNSNNFFFCLCSKISACCLFLRIHNLEFIVNIIPSSRSDKAFKGTMVNRKGLLKRFLCFCLHQKIYKMLNISIFPHS